MRYLFLLFILVPATEIAVLLLSGKTLGVLTTISIIILTGIIGAYLAKRQGLEAIKKAQEQLRSGRIPGDAILDGICILVGGTVLLLPGFITDIIGLLLLFPYTRKYFKWLMIIGIKRWIDKGNMKIFR